MKKITSILALFLMCFGISLQAADFTPVEGAKYLIRNFGKKLYVLHNVDSKLSATDNTVILSTWNQFDERSLFTISGNATDGFKIKTNLNHFVYAVNTNDANSNVGVKAEEDATCLWKIVDNGGKWNIIPAAGENGWNCRGSYNNIAHVGQWSNNSANDNKWEIFTMEDLFNEFVPLANNIKALQGKNVWSKPAAIQAIDDALNAKPATNADFAAWQKATSDLQKAVDGYENAFCEFPQDITLKLTSRTDLSKFLSTDGTKLIAGPADAEWTLSAASEAGYYKLYNKSKQCYAAPMFNKENAPEGDKYDGLYQNLVVTKDASKAGEYGFTTIVVDNVEYLLVSDKRLAADGNRYFHRNGSNGIVRWKRDDASSQWTANRAQVNVTYELYLDGVKCAEKQLTQISGDPYVKPNLGLYAEFVSFEGGEGSVSESNHVIKVNCAEKELPFVKSTDAATATWYAIDMHGRNIYWNGTAATDMVKLDKVEDDQLLLDAKYLWCFSGNAISGFKIINKAMGFDLALDGANPAKLVAFADAYSFLLQGNTSGIVNGVCFDKGGNKYLNHDASKECVGEYNQNDGGSACRFYLAKDIEERPIIAKADKLIADANNLMAVPAGAVGYSAYFETPAAANYAAAIKALENNKLDANLYAALEKEYTTANAAQKVAFDVNKYYRIKNFCRNLTLHEGSNVVNGEATAYMSTTSYMGEKAMSQAVSCHTTSLADAGCVWVFEATATEGQFLIKNLNLNKYISATASKASQYVTMVDKAEAGIYTQVDHKNGRFSFECASQGVGEHKQLHGSGYGVMNYNGSANDASAWYLVPATSLEVNMNKVSETASESWASLYLPFGVKLANGVEAFAGKVNGEVLNLTPVKNNVPANTAVILKGTEAKYVLDFAEVSGVVENNDLMGTVTEVKLVDALPEGAAEGTEPTRHNNEYFVLGNGAHGVGMYNPTGDVLKVNKAYIPASKTAGVNGLKFVFGETTGVEGVEVETENVVYYDLSGRRVANPVKGIYVVNGKKVLVK